MTDARLPGRWLGEIRFMDLSDRAWRVFTGALMWSAEQGTDGRIPTRYVRLLHPEGVTDADIAELVVCGVFAAVDDNAYTMPGWEVAKGTGLGQSLAADVATQRARKAQNQRDVRERRRGDLKTGDVTGDVAGYVGRGKGTSLKNSSAYVTGNRAGYVTGDAANIQTVRPGAHCPDGTHQLVSDGTCTRCDVRPGEAA